MESHPTFMDGRINTVKMTILLKEIYKFNVIFITILKRRYTHGRQTYEKMLNITNNQENANQNYNVIPYSCKNDHNKKTKQ